MAVVEIKSDLTLRSLNAALKKLSEIKNFRNEMINPRIKITGKSLFDQLTLLAQKQQPVDINKEFFKYFGYCKSDFNHQIGTFIICNKLKFGIEKNLNNIFIPQNEFNAQNAILSLEDGVISHTVDNKRFPFFANDISKLDLITDDKFASFISIFRQVVTLVKIFEFDIVKYISKNDVYVDHFSHLCHKQSHNQDNN